MTLSRRLQVADLAPGLSGVTDGVYQALVLDTADGAVVVDAPPSFGRELADVVTATTGKPVRVLIYSHAHGDHIGAAADVVGPDTRILAHERTAELLRRRGDERRPIPTETFRTSLHLEVGGQRIDLDHRGPNHSSDNVFVHFPDQRVVMLVDVVFPGTAPFRGLTVSSDIPGFLDAHDQLLAYDADTFVGGHFARWGSRGDVETARDYLRDLTAVTREALGSVEFAAVARRLAAAGRVRHPYEVAAAFDDDVAALVVPGLGARWGDRLEGLHVVVADHVRTMADSLRWDHNVLPGSPVSR